MPTAVSVDGVYKKFTRGERVDSLRDLIPDAARALVSRDQRERLRGREFWALRDVSWQVDPGEAVGIVGPNGAGKSTMLRLLSRILRPTSGHVEVRGRVGALIEVAAGFHPDLTGRENVFLQGAIYGMRRAEVARKLDAIIDFAGIGDFVDTPVKRYSTGMHARLGFSVAAHLDPDVLLIDEVLSVGDMAFQQKCIDRMKEFLNRGVAIVFVSHNLQAIAMLCSRAVFLRSEVVASGPAHDVLETYVRALSGTSAQADGVSILETQLRNEAGTEVRAAAPHARLTLRVTYRAEADVDDVTFGLVARRSTDNLVLYDGNVRDREIGVTRLHRGETIAIDFTFLAHLTRGQYDFECHVLHNPTRQFLARRRPVAILTVDEQRTFGGVVDLELRAAVAGRHMG